MTILGIILKQVESYKERGDIPALTQYLTTEYLNRKSLQTLNALFLEPASPDGTHFLALLALYCEVSTFKQALDSAKSLSWKKVDFATFIPKEKFPAEHLFSSYVENVIAYLKFWCDQKKDTEQLKEGMNQIVMFLESNDYKTIGGKSIREYFEEAENTLVANFNAEQWLQKEQITTKLQGYWQYDWSKRHQAVADIVKSFNSIEASNKTPTLQRLVANQLLIASCTWPEWNTNTTKAHAIFRYFPESVLSIGKFLGPKEMARVCEKLIITKTVFYFYYLGVRQADKANYSTVKDFPEVLKILGNNAAKMLGKIVLNGKSIVDIEKQSTNFPILKDILLATGDFHGLVKAGTSCAELKTLLQDYKTYAAEPEKVNESLIVIAQLQNLKEYFGLTGMRHSASHKKERLEHFGKLLNKTSKEEFEKCKAASPTFMGMGEYKPLVMQLDFEMLQQYREEANIQTIIKEILPSYEATQRPVLSAFSNVTGSSSSSSSNNNPRGKTSSNIDPKETEMQDASLLQEFVEVSLDDEGAEPDSEDESKRRLSGSSFN